MTWTEEHDIMFCREILTEEPFNFKHGSRERESCWDYIADTLNKVDQLKFVVDQRAVRDRFLKLEKACKKKTREELRPSGIAPSEPSELDQTLEEIIEKINSAEQQKEAKRDRQGERNCRGCEEEGNGKIIREQGQGKDVGKERVEIQVSI